MKLWRTLETRFVSLAQRGRMEAELDEELRFHLEMEIEKNLHSGMSATAARKAALIALGGAEQTKEDCRESWGTRVVFDFWRDVKFGSRQLLKSPGFALVAILTLGIGIGACSSIFSALDAALFRALPYSHPDRIVAVSEFSARGDTNVSGGAFEDWQRNSDSYEAVMLHDTVTRNLQTDQGPVRLYGREVTSGFLNTIGIEPLRGRGFAPSESAVGGNNTVVMLSEEAWEERFGRDEALVGQTIELDKVPFEVIGVLPAGAWIDRKEEFFIPAVIHEWQSWRSGRDNHWAKVWARLKPGVSRSQFENELNAIKTNLNGAYPEFKQDWSVAVYSLQEKLSEESTPVLFILFGAVALLLIIACANVANLLLARGAGRSREIALRYALGASRHRIGRQALTESLLLATLGGALGIVLSLGGIELLGLLASDLLPANMTPQLDARVLVVSLAITCGTGVAFGLLPAWKSKHADVNTALKTGDKSSSGRTRSQSYLVIAEVALTMVLLASAGLFLRSLVNVVNEDPGFKPESAITFELSLPEHTYGGPEKRVEFINSVLKGIEASPGVIAVGSSSKPVLTSNTMSSHASREDRPETRTDHLANIQHASGDYFDAMGARLINGRFITELDNRKDASAAVVIDQSLADTLFPNENPIGQFLHTWDAPWEIVGVVADMKLASEPHEGTIYMPHVHYPFEICIVVRSRTEHGKMVESIKQQVAKIDSGVGLANVRTLETALGNSFAQRRLILYLIGGFAIAATLLACIGLYGVMSYTVATRQREWGIRRALGASSRAIVRKVVLDGGKLTFIGLLAGTAVAVGTSRMLASQLYQVSSYDFVVFATTLATIASVSVLSCWIPAHRASRSNPNAALRVE